MRSRAVRIGTMNGCSVGVFMIRWRSSDTSFHVQSSARYSGTAGSPEIKTGAFGYISGTNCEQPMFSRAQMALSTTGNNFSAISRHSLVPVPQTASLL
jgi:hypothetical protein